MLDNVPDQLTQFRTKKWVEKKYGARETYSTSSQIKFKTSMLKSILYDYSNMCILRTIMKNIIETIAIDGKGADDDAKRLDERNKGVILEVVHWPFTGFMSKLNNTEIDNAKDVDVVRPIYNYANI